MQQQPPNSRRKGGGPKAAKPPRVSKRALALPPQAREDLLRIADFLSGLWDDAKRREPHLTRKDIHQRALPYCGSVAENTISRFASRTYMATTSGVDRPLLNALLYALGASPLDLEEYLAGIPALTEEEREMLALMRAMTAEGRARQLAIAHLDAQLEGRPPSISLPRPPTREEEIAELDEHHRLPFRHQKDN